MKKKLISFCIPCYNEGSNVIEIYNKIQKEISSLREKYDFEILFEDNYSSDNTVDLLKHLAKQDMGVKVILNSRNFGAMKNSGYIMFQAKGDAVIGLPCDLQVPLNLIGDYLKFWEEGYQVVLGQISSSQEKKSMFKARGLYYQIMDHFSDVPQLYHVTGAGLFDKSAVSLIQSLNEPEPNFRYLVTELGLNYKLVPYIQPIREYGRSSYSISKYFNQAIDSFVDVSKKPLRYITNLGIVLLCISFLYFVAVIVCKVILSMDVNLYNAILLGVILFFFSLQIFCTGLIGEYINLLLKRKEDRPMVIERERINFDKKD